MFRTLLLTGCALALSACASIGNLAAVNKKETIGSGFNSKSPAGVFIDAEQRAVLSNRRADEDLRVVCAEPAPDALSAIAAQAGVSVSDISNAVSAEGGVSEAAANIGLRTQTIQTLRDGFYRVCEAYMNGLSQEQYSIMLRRFQTNMIALLAIEQLPGAVKGGDAVVSASAGRGMDFREQYLQRAAMASSEQTRLATEIEQTNEAISILEDVNAQCESGGFGDGCSASDVERRGREIRDLRAQRRAMERAQASAEATARHRPIRRLMRSRKPCARSPWRLFAMIMASSSVLSICAMSEKMNAPRSQTTAKTLWMPMSSNWSTPMQCGSRCNARKRP